MWVPKGGSPAAGPRPLCWGAMPHARTMAIVRREVLCGGSHSGQWAAGKRACSGWRGPSFRLHFGQRTPRPLRTDLAVRPSGAENVRRRAVGCPNGPQGPCRKLSSWLRPLAMLGLAREYHVAHLPSAESMDLARVLSLVLSTGQRQRLGRYPPGWSAVIPDALQRTKHALGCHHARGLRLGLGAVAAPLASHHRPPPCDGGEAFVGRGGPRRGGDRSGDRGGHSTSTLYPPTPRHARTVLQMRVKGQHEEHACTSPYAQRGTRRSISQP